jgi:hypothetical protein
MPCWKMKSGGVTSSSLSGMTWNFLFIVCWFRLTASYQTGMPATRERKS